MRILSVSDIVEPSLYPHFEPNLIPPVDLIFSCGDLPPEYLSFLRSKLNAPLYFVKGNHDIRANGYNPMGCVNIDNQLVLHKGVRILGLEGSHWYNGQPHQYTEAQMKIKIRKLHLQLWWRKGVDIIITHAPPRHIHDEEDMCHRGFESFRRLIDRYSLAYFIHGHIHLYDVDRSGRTTLVNHTKVVNTYGHFIFEIEDRQLVE